MRSHTYNGETFKVAKDATAKDADKYAAILLAYAHRARGEAGTIVAYEVDRMPEGAVTVPKPRGRPRKVIVPTAPHMPGDTRTEPVESTLYAQGFYREPCRTCGKGIPLTGKKGRAPVYHAECRPK